LFLMIIDTWLYVNAYNTTFPFPHHHQEHDGPQRTMRWADLFQLIPLFLHQHFFLRLLLLLLFAFVGLGFGHEFSCHAHLRYLSRSAV
jgi:hypothetical protein